MACNDNSSDSDQNDVQELLDLGITQVSTDGTTVSHNLSVVQQRARENKRNDKAALLNNEVRPVAFNARMWFRG